MSHITTHLTAGEVMDRSASLLNDTARSVFSYAAQLPYLLTALDDLQMEFELNNIPVTNQTNAVITITVGTTQINPPGATVPVPPLYPEDLVEIQGLYERLAGSDDPFIQMTRREFLPHYLEGQPVDSLLYWIWQDQVIKFNPQGALTPREVKIDYIKAIFAIEITGPHATLNIINAKNYLAFRTAALCARFIGENPERADSLDGQAQNAMDQVVGIGTKGRQAITTRRRPFMAAYRSRGIW